MYNRNRFYFSPMDPLTCPLCCNETFVSHNSLKTHILQIVDHIDNLACPSCNEKCADLLDLADHLGRECINLSTNQKENLSPRKRRNEHDAAQIPDLSKVKTEVSDVCETDIGKFNLQFLWAVMIVTNIL